MVARLDANLYPAPSVRVVASHFAKLSAFGLMRKGLERLPAIFADFGDLRLGFPLAAFDPKPMRRRPVATGAGMAAILPVTFAVKGFSALGAGVMDWLCHGETITRTRNDYKYFDIACRRVEAVYREPDLFIAPPPTKPVQESML